jgi:hypothetical protein
VYRASDARSAATVAMCGRRNQLGKGDRHGRLRPNRSWLLTQFQRNNLVDEL